MRERMLVGLAFFGGNVKLLFVSNDDEVYHLFLKVMSIW